MRAPRPTLLIYNAEDSCCFRAPLVKPYVFAPIVPFFKLYGKEDGFKFYQSTSISLHNYGLDDREQSYDFFAKHFHLHRGGPEIPVGRDVKDYDQLSGGIPEDNLTIFLSLARKMAGELKRPLVPAGGAEKTAWASAERTRLRDVVRLHPVAVTHTMLLANINHYLVDSISYRWEMSNGLGATGVWVQEAATKASAPLTIVLNDGGKKASAKARARRDSSLEARRNEWLSGQPAQNDIAAHWF